MPINVPPKMPVPWAASGLKNTIPAASNPVTGNAGYDQGFTAINMTPRTAGGIPPFGQDFNGIFYAVTEALRYLETGAGFPYDGPFATAVGGYPLGARVQRTDGYGSWLNTSANNTTDPEAFGAGWAPEGSGITSVAMSNANITLTALQAARPVVVITGVLTANLNLIFPTYARTWNVINNATGAFTVTCKTASGGGVALGTGKSGVLVGDGTNIASAIKESSKSLASQGYRSIEAYPGDPQPIILQWGGGLFSASTPVTFPIAFPNACLQVVMGAANFDGSQPALQRVVAISAFSASSTGFSASSSNGASAAGTWFAVGY